MKLSKKKINRNTIVNWLIFGVSMLVCLFLLEMVMRQIYPSFDPRGNVQFYKNENGVVTAIPNFKGRQWKKTGDFDVSIDINKYGFRDKKDLKYAKEKDIILIGDSFTFGHGVEEHERFGNRFQEMIGDSIQVYNIGISGTQFLEYQRSLAYAKNHGAKAKNILIGVCMENDILDYPSILEVEKNKEVTNWSGLKEWLNSKSCLYTFIATQFQSNKKIRDFLKSIGLIKDSLTSYSFDVPTDKAMNSSLSLLEELVANHNSLVILIPSRLNWLEGRAEDTNETHQKFKNLLKDKGIEHLDLKLLFDNEFKNPLQEAFFPNDGHWIKFGHELVAEEIFKKWQKLKPSEILSTSEDSNFNEE